MLCVSSEDTPEINLACPTEVFIALLLPGHMKKLLTHSWFLIEIYFCCTQKQDTG